MIKNKLLRRLHQLIFIIENPDSLKARFSGCYFEIYNMLYRIKSMNIIPRTIIDIGANRGMFSKTSNYLFNNAEIIAYEPLQDCFKELQKMSRIIPSFECYNYAIGNKFEKGQIFKSEYDYSSSLLKMAKLHKKAFPVSDNMEIENIQITTLDKELLGRKLKKPILVKIDVQGYENFVIDGAREILRETDILICELSFYKLYENQSLFEDIYNQLKALNFRFFGSLNEILHPANSAILQIDGLFINNNFNNIVDIDK